MAAPGGIELSALDGIIEFIKQVGFPIFVAGWFMLRTDRKLDDLTDAINGREKKR